MKYANLVSFGLIVGLASAASSAQVTDAATPVGESQSSPVEAPGAGDHRTLVAGPMNVSPDEMAVVLERVSMAIGPATLQELAAPAPDSDVSVGSGGVSMPMRSWTRDDGVKVTIMSAQKGLNSLPTNVGVWHNTESGGGGLAALFGGDAGELVLRLHEPSSDPAAQPIGFLRVRLFDAGVEEEYSLENGRWVMRRYEGTETDATRHPARTLINPARQGQADVVEALIAQGVAIDARAADGTSALIQAADLGHSDVVAILLSAQASVDIQGDDGRTPLMVAARGGHGQIVRSLLDSSADMLLQDAQGNTALHYAKSGEIAQLLIDRGAVVDARSREGDTPLSKAADRGYLDVVGTLLASGAPVDLGSEKGKTPLNNAAWQGYSDIVDLLLAAGATVDLRTTDGANALLLASTQGHSGIVQTLLAAQSPTDAQTDDGRTALMMATIRGHTQVVADLIGSQANVDLRNEDGATALHYAKTADLVQLLIDGGAEVDARNNLGHTPLAYAAADDKLDAVEALIANGATIDAQGNDGLTALMLAANRGHGDIVGVLLQGGADVSLEDAKGGTAVAYAKSESIRVQLAGDPRPLLTYSDGEDALLRADFDQAIGIFQGLAVAGDKEAEAEATRIIQLSEDERTQWIAEQGVEAVRVGDLDQAERLFLIAVERGHPLAPELLDIVVQTKKEVGPLDEEIERLQSEAGFQCVTTLSMDGDEILTAENCTAGTPQTLIDRHRAQVRAAVDNVRESGFAESASTITTGGESSRSISIQR